MKKTPLERAAEFAQACVAKTPVVILGSGASAAHGIPGMGPLAKKLMSAAPPPAMTAEEASQWDAFLTELTYTDLESALTRVQFTERQTHRVVEVTRDFLLPYDLEVFNNVLSDRRCLPLARLYRHLFKSTHKTIDVVTPNYDRIAEYAADVAEVSHHVGFSYGYMNKRAKDPNTRVYHGGQPSRTVCVWKVHGSFDWFRDADEVVLGLPTCRETPVGFTPMMITPGVEKYRLAYDEPFRTIMRCSDAAMERARAFLCIGFGFNDQHLQTKLIERCEADLLPIVVITMELTKQAKAVLFGGRCRQFLALERSASGTRMYMKDEPDGVELIGQDIWQLGSFLNMAIGAEA
ncbi:SIR2 family protein [Microvirga sp. 2TAF3]|uniref:SIR2 family protein n=1 Tax=Microvirga sp. 2TAF3 TaxID=3233014 RepID=UPI003F97B090